jgi:hypothetical protein
MYDFNVVANRQGKTVVRCVVKNPDRDLLGYNVPAYDFSPDSMIVDFTEAQARSGIHLGGLGFDSDEQLTNFEEGVIKALDDFNLSQRANNSHPNPSVPSGIHFSKG